MPMNFSYMSGGISGLGSSFKYETRTADGNNGSNHSSAFISTSSLSRYLVATATFRMKYPGKC